MQIIEASFEILDDLDGPEILRKIEKIGRVFDYVVVVRTEVGNRPYARPFPNQTVFTLYTANFYFPRLGCGL